ncbi:MAG: sodium:solute symporter [Verrucomicrobiota bacterium]|nr:sodium:solute symporter [Verrucomicrobiota bacterium]
MKTADALVLVLYIAVVVGVGFWFARRSKTSEGFMKAGGRLPGWVVGLSLFGTYLSSNTFIGVPGKAYAGNWNAFVFSLSIPIAVLIASRWFVDYYRRSGTISAYENLETRFGPWARLYAVVCYLLTQIARGATIMLGVSIGLQQITGWSLPAIILIAGILVTLYTLIGGIEAVIWTDAIQSIVLTLGAILVTGLLLAGHPEGPSGALAAASDAGKFSLGDWSLTDLTSSTVWVVLVYGLFINLTNFGIDQNYIQRYHTANSTAEARRSLWVGALLYVPVSLLFFLIGSLLFSFYQQAPDEVEVIRQLAGDRKFEDSILPHFMTHHLPPGVGGLILAALAAAAMSTVDTSLNSASTITLKDLWIRLVRKNAEISDKESMFVLRSATVFWGAVATGTALLLTGNAKNILDIWWQLSGIFAGGMLGLFLLGMIVKRADNTAAAVAVTLGVKVIFWISFSKADWMPQPLHLALHSNLTIVAGTLTIFLVGLFVSSLSRREST